MTREADETEEAQAARVRVKLKKSPLAADLLAEERQNPASAAMFEEDLAALRREIALHDARADREARLGRGEERGRDKSRPYGLTM